MATEPRSPEHHAQTSAQHHPAGAGQPQPQNQQRTQQRQQDEKSRLESDKKRLSEEREQRAKQQQERESKKGTPTPTQEECDLLKLGHAVELADDGSGPDPNMPKQDEQQGKPYSHRQMSAAR
jgi:hypothetical protein